ncbi:hypothetical protein KUCAC02_021564 [Chaenocephalus aceratus]|uniref:Uncharacterized protein n=1 Tax=Chaenocephalus aceratus TaxID=36190 RepID=A0ACB9XFS8_CHAAC|nr:hypothetical protein KUCAC02_021564 [Chaenocephalus aceratus]
MDSWTGLIQIFICNASDNSGRYSYQAQPAICRWNLVKSWQEALAPELPPDRAEEVVDGADFTNTFRSLSQISCPTEGEGEEEEELVRKATELLLQQCASLEELKAANKPTMDTRELTMLLSMAQSNPALFQMISDRATIVRQLEIISKLKDLMETSQEELQSKHAEDWSAGSHAIGSVWRGSWRARAM